jgi:putative oxidoreductase
MSFGLLLLRLTIGGTVAAHGAQKLAPPRYHGHGIDTTTGFVAGLGFRPARAHAWLLAVAELAGGLALAGGFFTPFAAAAIIGVMAAAIGAVHYPKGFFAQNGGIEFPLVLGLGALAVTATGPGDWSIDHALDWQLTGAGWTAVALGMGVAAALATLAARHAPELRFRRRHAAHA